MENFLLKSKDFKFDGATKIYTKTADYGQKVTIKIHPNDTVEAHGAWGDKLIIKPDGTIISGKGKNCKNL